MDDGMFPAINRRAAMGIVKQALSCQFIFLSFIKSGLGLFFFVAFPLRWQWVSTAPACYPHALGRGAR
jgi:hypothetical protein